MRGLDIGCGANFIYCLLGAALFEWPMVGVDVTEVAVTWASLNRGRNPHLQHLLEVRRSGAAGGGADGAAEGAAGAEEGVGEGSGLDEDGPSLQVSVTA